MARQVSRAGRTVVASRKLGELDECELRAIVLLPASAFGYETDLWTVEKCFIHTETFSAVVKQQILRIPVATSVAATSGWFREAGLMYQKNRSENTTRSTRRHDVNGDATK